ncbi:MAG: type IV pilus modification protein PilV [Pseudohongiellaceae bacterium]
MSVDRKSYQPSQGMQRQSVAGVAMIEVLFALMIISVGFLNIAGLQTAAKKSLFDSLQRTSSVILAHDIAEKMRTNTLGLENFLTGAAGVGGGTLTEPAQSCDSASKCSSLQLAAYDLWLWEQSMDGASESRSIDGTNTDTGGLVNPTGCVTGPPTGEAGVYTITIVWRGLNELTNVSANTCGVGSGKYGANEEYRRILILNTYISP